MQCFRPIAVKLSDDERKKRMSLGSEFPIEYRYSTYKFVPCGKCEACLHNRKMDWMFRLLQEYRYCESAYFVTLTYDDEHIPFDKNGFPCVCKSDVQKFFKRFRKSIYPFKIRYFLISEYGPKTFRPHYHLLLFDFPKLLNKKLDELIEHSWKLGFFRVDPCNPSRIAYCSAYCLDRSQIPKSLVKNFLLCSRRPAIGYKFIDTPDLSRSCEASGSFMWRSFQSDGTSFRSKIPRYYTDKFASDELRNRVTLENNIRIAENYFKLRRDQEDWLVKHNYEVNIDTLKTAYPGSPRDLFLQSQNEFKNKVRNKFKIKQNG